MAFRDRANGLLWWDERGGQKPASCHLDDLGPTRSRKAARLTHIKPGYSSPPRAPILVPALPWLAVLLIGRLAQQGPPLLAAHRWWSTRGPHASFKRDAEGQLLHIFDQGEACACWLGLLLAYCLRCVLRWRKDSQRLAAAGNRRRTCKSAQGKRGWSQRWGWDARRARGVIATVLVLTLAHPDHPEQPLSLVVCRRQGRSRWYLLTAEAITSDEQAWQVVFASMHSSHSPDFAVLSVACGKTTLLTSLPWRTARQVDAGSKQPSHASSG